MRKQLTITEGQPFSNSKNNPAARKCYACQIANFRHGNKIPILLAISMVFIKSSSISNNIQTNGNVDLIFKFFN